MLQFHSHGKEFWRSTLCEWMEDVELGLSKLEKKWESPQHRCSFLRVWKGCVATGSDPEWEGLIRHVHGLLCWLQREATERVSTGRSGWGWGGQHNKIEIKREYLNIREENGWNVHLSLCSRWAEIKCTLPGNTVGTNTLWAGGSCRN